MHNNHRRVGWNDWFDATEAGNAHRWRTAPKGLLGNPVSRTFVPKLRRDALASDPGRRNSRDHVRLEKYRATHFHTAGYHVEPVAG